MSNPLKSLAAYSHFVAETLSRPNIKNSTVAVWSDSPYTGIAEGEVLFDNGLRLRLREEVDLEAGLIFSYGYEVYRGEDRLYWYDDFPHPHDPTTNGHKLPQRLRVHSRSVTTQPHPFDYAARAP